MDSGNSVKNVKTVKKIATSLVETRQVKLYIILFFILNLNLKQRINNGG